MMKLSIVVLTIFVPAALLAQTTTEQKPQPPAAQTQPAAAPSQPAPPATPAPPPLPPPEPSFPASVPKITAGYQEKGDDLILARNYVDFTYDDYRLQCDLMRYFPKTQEIEAEGNVILEEGDQRLAGEKLHFNIRTKRGVMFDASGTAEPDLHFVANQVEKYDDRKYKSEGGQFTSCTQPNPRWKISSSKADLEVDDHITLKNAVFKLKSVPIFYLPYMRYPIRDDNRATGFLMPNYGHSSKKGTILGEAFFWAINRSQDATIAYRYFSEIGRGAEGEYRYIFSNSSSGFANVFYIFQNTTDSSTTDSGQQGVDSKNLKGYYLNLEHRQVLPFGIVNQTDVTLLTSFAFKQIYSNNYYSITDPRKTSTTFFTKSFGYDSLNLQLRRDALLRGLVRTTEYYYVKKKRHTRYVYTENTDIINRFPDIALTHNQQKLGPTPLLFSATATFLGYETYTHKIDTGKRTTEDVPGISFTRLSWDPTISLPITNLSWLTFTPSATFSGSYWTDSYSPGTQTPGAGGLLRNTFVSKIEIYGPKFNRVFSTPRWSFSKKWEHSIEPYFRIDYTSKFKDVRRVLQGAADYVGSGDLQVVTYQLTNTLWGKRTLIPGYDPVPVDILSWKITQSYLPNSLAFDSKLNKRTRFLDINSQLAFKLTPIVDISFITDYNIYWKRFVDYRLRANLTKTDAFSASVGWFYGRNVQTGGATDNSLTASGGFGIKRLGIRIDGSLAYNPLYDDKLQSAQFRWSQSFQCWGLEFMWQRYRLDQVGWERAFYFTVHIGSIGTISERIGGQQF